MLTSMEVIFSLFRCISLPHGLLSGIPFAESPVGRFSPPQAKYSLDPLQSFDASNYGPPCIGTVCSSHISPLFGRKTFLRSFQVMMYRRIVLPSTYSGLPRLVHTPLCLSWSGFMGVDLRVGGRYDSELLWTYLSQAVLLPVMMEPPSSTNQWLVYAPRQNLTRSLCEGQYSRGHRLSLCL